MSTRPKLQGYAGISRTQPIRRRTLPPALLCDIAVGRRFIFHANITGPRKSNFTDVAILRAEILRNICKMSGFKFINNREDEICIPETNLQTYPWRAIRACAINQKRHGFCDAREYVT
ncbi:hypothetical protein [Bradyrhizobium yuanmingense]|uniref:hypothetical protein n=1 Tax=Bradyrhizobium yuanmingense TaxID=108015 RepID=UPI0023B968DD|nr:hypothetical protein [Bradyrhizobium yuanmingense]MDF0581988.1 hypothetical protein [Bradyrhizobium yuanmingense]